MIFFATLKFLIVSIMMLAGRVVTAMSSPATFQIHPNGNKNKCLDVRGAVFENNTPVNMSASLSHESFITPPFPFFYMILIVLIIDMIATVLALKIGGFLMGRPRSDWRALIFASTQEPVRGPFLFVLHIQWFIGKNQKH